ncbi:MAG: hypothetical protein ACI8TV_001645 [Porticoccaceae bacterium]
MLFERYFAFTTALLADYVGFFANTRPQHNSFFDDLAVVSFAHQIKGSTPSVG